MMASRMNSVMRAWLSWARTTASVWSSGCIWKTSALSTGSVRARPSRVVSKVRSSTWPVTGTWTMKRTWSWYPWARPARVVV